MGTFLLVACSTSKPVDTVDPLAPFTGQKVVWESCDAQFSADNLEFLDPIVNRLECATLQTPLSWDDPGRESVNLGVLRVRAPNPTKRKGAIFLNPGGPGGDGLLLAAIFGFVFDSAERFGDPSGASLKALSDNYDILGFSPRGVGESFRLYCGTNKLFPEGVSFYDTSEENLNNLLLGSRYVADACEANPLTKYVDTEQTVRDMDLIRQLLGDEKLNYLGYSYGSWLGAWYAKTFPEHSGNIVLDANTEFSATFKDVFELQPLGFNRAFTDVALAYVARNSSVYNLGMTKEEAFSVFSALPDSIKEPFTFGFVGVLGDLYSSFAVPEVGFKLMAAQGVAEVVATLKPNPDFDVLLDAVLAYPYSNDAEVNARVANYAFEIAFDYYLSLEAYPGFIELPSGSALFQAITCNDTPWPDDPAVYKAAARASAVNYPLFGVELAQQPCAFWSGPTTTKPDVPADMPAVLMVQTGFDAATPAEGALRAFESLPNAKLVFVKNEMSHTAFPYGTPCVDEKVATYLLTGELPSERVSNCEARPLPGENQVYPPEGGPSPQATGSFSLQAALHPTSGNSLNDRIHELIRENAADFYSHNLRDEREKR